MTSRCAFKNSFQFLRYHNSQHCNTTKQKAVDIFTELRVKKTHLDPDTQLLVQLVAILLQMTPGYALGQTVLRMTSKHVPLESQGTNVSSYRSIATAMKWKLSSSMMFNNTAGTSFFLCSICNWYHQCTITQTYTTKLSSTCMFLKLSFTAEYSSLLIFS